MHGPTLPGAPFAHRLGIPRGSRRSSSLAGAIVSTVPGRGSGITGSVIAGVVFALTALYLVRSHSPITYTVAICIFMFSWPILYAALFAAVAVADTVGTATLSLSPAMSASFALGPLIGGKLIARHGFQSLQYLGLMGALAALLCLLPSRLARRASIAQSESGHE
jgi:DHA1 family inner membrane transport protein